MSRPKQQLRHALTLVLLLAFFAQGLIHARHASLTFDEGPHLAAGYATLRTGDFRLQPVHIHPPLANALAAAPLLLQRDLPDPRTIDGWKIASLSAITDAVVWQYPHPRRLALAGRLPILLLGVLLGAVIFRWAREVGGWRAGSLALALYAFDPNVIAHGSLITTDVAAVFFSVATLYTLERSRTTEHPIPRWIGVGVLLGQAQLAKVSALMLVPVAGVILGRGQEGGGTGQGAGVTQLLRRAAYVFMPVGLVVWAGYGFEIGSVPGLPFPMPAATHLKIFLALREHYALGHPTFLMGRVSDQGWWWYFPMAFLLKTPLPVLGLGAYSVFRIAYRFHASRITHHATRITLYFFPLLYAATSLFSTVNIGYRHLLPLLPFIYIGSGNTMAHVLRRPHASRITHHASRILTLGVLIWLMIGTLGTAPHYLTFFNEIAGGPEKGYTYLVDSNLDWGQNLWDLRAWMERNDAEHVYYAHYSPARPEAYGINADFLPPDPRAGDFTPWRPEPGLYAIGATVLQGPYAPDLNTYAWFRAHEPTARPGHALFVYEVPTSPAPTWVGTCMHPDVGLPDEVIAHKLGVSDLRVLHFDCEQSWAFPAEGPGRYILPAEVEIPPTARLSLEARQPDGTTAYAVYRVHGAPMPEHAASIVSENGPLRFLGHQMDSTEAQPGDIVILQTFWEVERLPNRPLSLMAHVISTDGTPIAIGDGLGVPIDQWQPGDVIVQRHPLNIPPTTPGGEYVIYTGGYWLDNMERWNWKTDSAPVDRLALGNLQIVNGEP